MVATATTRIRICLPPRLLFKGSELQLRHLSLGKTWALTPEESTCGFGGGNRP
jgi:hypothetical protein